MLIVGKSGVNKSELVIEMIGLRVRSRSSANSMVATIGTVISMTAAVCHSSFFRATPTLEISLKYISSLLSTIPSPNANDIVPSSIPMLPIPAMSISPEARAVAVNFALISSNCMKALDATSVGVMACTCANSFPCNLKPAAIKDAVSKVVKSV